MHLLLRLGGPAVRIIAMLVYAGIDEAGYGPMFGPLVIARSVFVLENCDVEAEPPSMWSLMPSAICKRVTDKKRRIAVNDSKQLYTPAAGLAHLERGVLAFAGLAGCEPATVDELLAAVAYDDDSRQPDQLWYWTDDGGPGLPTSMDAGLLTIARTQLAGAAAKAKIALPHLSAAVLYEDRFNRMVAATRSKARCSWTFVGGHLDAIWQEFGRHQPRVVIDRQGGRTRYAEPLSLLFEGARIEVRCENPLLSEYLIESGDRSMIVSFAVGSEEQHLPVALASMTAKYVREVLMMRFNAFWHRHAPQLKPTAGYAKDGKRFLADIEPVIDQLAIDRTLLVRQR